MRRSRWWGHRTGYGVFVLGTGMGMITNLVTGDPERWPGALQPIATYSPAIGAGLLAAVGAKATWDVWRNGVARPQWTGSEPYPGLTAYTEERAGVFFGRRREVEELVDRVRHARAAAGRFVPVIGPSGSGKSSLVQAGLLPALRPGREFEVLPPFSPGASAVGELAGVLGVDLAAAAGLALEAARQGHPAPPLPGVLAALSTLRAGARGVLLIVDQLEEAGDLRLDPAARRVWRGDAEVDLTAREFSLLAFLARRAGDVLSKRQILDGVWDTDFDGDPNIVEVYIRHLRNKVDRPYGREAIQTVRGAGYRLGSDGG